MTTENEQSPSVETKEANGHSLLFARMLWAMVGPCALLGALVPASKASWLSGWEALYVAIIAMMVGGRYMEQTSGHGTTLYNEPSTWTHFRQYVIKLFLVALGMWFLAKFGVRYFGSLPEGD